MKGDCEKFFLTLSTRLKIRIIESLHEKEKAVKQISQDLGEERSKVSHALRDLLGCNFVNVKEKGRQRIYELNQDTVEPLLELVDRHMRKYCADCSR